MSNSKIIRKVRKKLGRSNPKPAMMKKSNQPQLKVQQPTAKGCCGQGR